MTDLDYINNKAASRRLAEDISSYWRKRGKPYRAWVEEQEYKSEGRYEKAPNIIYVVRSNLGFEWDAENECYRGVKV
jgi:hypothetical protein